MPSWTQSWGGWLGEGGGSLAGRVARSVCGWCGCGRAAEPRNGLLRPWNRRVASSSRRTEGCRTFYLGEGIPLSTACISPESVLLPWIWFFLILWFYVCFIFKIILRYQSPQKNSRRYIGTSLLRSGVFVAGRWVREPVSLEAAELLMISHHHS